MDETIAAISTPTGEGGIGIIRISGPQAEPIGLKCMRHPDMRPINEISPRKVYFGIFVDSEGRRIDEAVFFLFKGPKSYTREDLLEIQLHGNGVLLEEALSRVLECGARLAEPGEFTKRAFMNGRIDLTQAEALIDLIRARTERGGRVASTLLAGGLSRKVKSISDELTVILAELEASLDYPEEDVPMAEHERQAETLRVMEGEIESLVKEANAGKILREGATIVLAGRPNVGKSSLMNAFLREERAIVTDIPGTTRDAIIESVEIRGFPIHLVDTAGLRDTDHPIERLGIDRTLDWINRADLILILFENNSDITDEDRKILQLIKDNRWIPVVNKTDQPAVLNERTLRDLVDDRTVIYISANDKTGFEALEDAIFMNLGISDIEPDREILVTRIRQKTALENTIGAIRRALRGLIDGITEDLIAVELRLALHAMAEITGENADERVMDTIFANFCLGK